MENQNKGTEQRQEQRQEQKELAFFYSPISTCDQYHVNQIN